jgi:hypothetical protein
VEQGFLYGAEHSDQSLAAPGANNLGALLRQHFGWDRTGEVVESVTFRGSPVTIGGLMKTSYTVGIVACAIALGVHTRRNDPRALMAMAAPWILFYALMPQQSGRYLVWASAATAMCAGIGVGPVLLHLLISVFSALTILHVLILYSHNPTWWPALTDFLNGMYPGASWLTLMCAAVLLYLALTPTPRRRSPKVLPLEPLAVLPYETPVI